MLDLPRNIDSVWLLAEIVVSEIHTIISSIYMGKWTGSTLVVAIVSLGIAGGDLNIVVDATSRLHSSQP